jgi:hypothetical protein
MDRLSTTVEDHSMTIPDEHVINEVVARWQASPSGRSVRHVPFPSAREGECHANAAAYVVERGGLVVHGFLLHQGVPWSVYVRAHSVVCLRDGDLVDPTLTDLARTGHAYFEHIGTADLFLRNTKAWAEVPVAIGVVPDILGNHCWDDPPDEFD